MASLTSFSRLRQAIVRRIVRQGFEAVNRGDYGRVIREQAFLNRADALEAAGLSE